MRGSSALVSLLSLVLLFLLEVSANPSHPIHLPANETILGQLELAEGEGQCGKQGDGKECPSEECCSYWGWYGTGPAYCASETCQSQCQEPEEPDFSTKSLLMTVKIHHGGIMKRTPDKHYVGGIMYYVNAAELNLVEFKKMAELYGYANDSITFWHRCGKFVNQSNMGENAKQILYENSSGGNFSDSEANLLDDVTIDTHGKRNQSILEEGELLSVEIKRKIADIDGDSDCCNSEDTESLHSDSETESLNFPQQNPKTDGDNPVLGLEYVFDTKMNFKNAVATHEIKNGKSIQWCRNDNLRAEAICIHHPECKWKIKASKCKETRLSRNWSVAEFRDKVSVELRAHVTLSQAKRANMKAIALIDGDIKDQYKMMWEYCNEINRTNSGSTIYMKLVDNEVPNEPQRFQRIYICFAACKLGFRAGCRKIVGVDGCWLKGPMYGTQLLSAVGLDADNNILPIAYAIVEKESKETWTWFLNYLAADLCIGENGWTFMSDKQKGLIEAVDT
ncbi:hypothetical protein T459_10484 [Capsicum annuum]|uniref:Chitin-binding type-1 domain-containing protein n=1 Tax=Capsicum annuum TaxID=4072 RepID=A0A2G3A2D3_CAPAN|nr:hypothetical protein T459_10484 [Capsicum annuum]